MRCARGHAGFLVWLVRAVRREEAVAIARFIRAWFAFGACLSTVAHREGQAAAGRADRVPRDAVRLGADCIVPVVGRLDDAIVVALVLRRVLRATGSDVVGEYWPGPPATLRVLLRAAGQLG